MVPDFDTLTTVAVNTDVDERDVIVAIILPTGVGAIEPLEEEPHDGVESEGAEVIKLLLGATGVMLLLGPNNGEDIVLEDELHDDAENEGSEVMGSLLGATGAIPLLGLDNGEDIALEESFGEGTICDDDLMEDKLVPWTDMKELLVPNLDR